MPRSLSYGGDEHRWAPNASHVNITPDAGSWVNMVSGQCRLGAGTNASAWPRPKSTTSPALTALWLKSRCVREAR